MLTLFLSSRLLACTTCSDTSYRIYCAQVCQLPKLPWDVFPGEKYRLLYNEGGKKKEGKERRREEREKRDGKEREVGEGQSRLEGRMLRKVLPHSWAFKSRNHRTDLE